MARIGEQIESDDPAPDKSCDEDSEHSSDEESIIPPTISRDSRNKKPSLKKNTPSSIPPPTKKPASIKKKQQTENEKKEEKSDDSGEEEKSEAERNEEVSEEESSEESEEESEEENKDTQMDMADMKAEEYFSATKYNNSRHHWLCGFYNYLSKPGAGYKNTNTRVQHTRQVEILMKHQMPGRRRWGCCLVQVGPSAYREKNKAPGTIISYLTSFEKFLKFVTNKRYNKSMPPLHPSYINLFSALIPDLKGWRSTVDLNTQPEQVAHYLDEADNLLSAKEVDDLKTSKPYTDGLKALSLAKSGWNQWTTVYCCKGFHNCEANTRHRYKTWPNQ